jgi:hypothetical protein
VDAWDAAGPEAASDGDRHAVCTAEQTVSDAWIGRLLLAESQAEIVVDACVRVRKRAGDSVRSAPSPGPVGHRALLRDRRPCPMHGRSLAGVQR